MPAYIFADLRIINRPRYEEYRLAVRDAIRGHGGRHVVRTSKVEVIEGGWAPPRLVVLEGNWEPQLLMLLEFASEAAARAAYAEVRDGEARKLGVNSAMIDMVLVHGVAAESEENSTFL